MGESEEVDGMTRLAKLELKWRKEPAFRKAYDALDEEFVLIEAMIKARLASGLSQTELAKRMKTTQSVIARLESGKVHPSTRTLSRLAAATGTRLRISFERTERRGRN
jgi:ribosome-binding protein aMBF1 (putative translation factor)